MRYVNVMQATFDARSHLTVREWRSLFLLFFSTWKVGIIVVVVVLSSD